MLPAHCGITEDFGFVERAVMTATGLRGEARERASRVDGTGVRGSVYKRLCDGCAAYGNGR